MDYGEKCEPVGQVGMHGNSFGRLQYDHHECGRRWRGREDEAGVVWDEDSATCNRLEFLGQSSFTRLHRNADDPWDNLLTLSAPFDSKSLKWEKCNSARPTLSGLE